MYTDKTLVCKDCGREFVFSASEQEFYGQGNGRPMFDAVCAECGKPCKVPFEPRNDQPVFCSECFKNHRG